MCDQDAEGTAEGKADQDLVADLLKVLAEQGSIDHLDAYGGALFAMDLQSAFEDLRKKGWEFDRPKEGE